MTSIDYENRNKIFPRQKKRPVIDMAGQKINKLFVLEQAEDYINPRGMRFVQWRCKCDCGNICVKRGTALRSGKAISCGCSRSESNKGKNVKDLSNQVFGRWTVLHKSDVSKGRVVYWTCRCECGTIRDVSGHSLRDGESTSCGCAKMDALTINHDLATQQFGHLTVVQRVDDEFKYGRNNKMWQCKCSCGNICTVRESDLLNGSVQSCGCAGTSLNEEYFEEILIARHIPYEKEVTFSDCKGQTRNLRFDFKIVLDNQDVYVELDGAQHYRPVEYFGGYNGFCYQQSLDFYKTKYLLDHHYKFVRFDCSHRPSKRQLEKMFDDWLLARNTVSNGATLHMEMPDITNDSSRNISRMARYFNFNTFYKRELALWRENPVYKDGLTVQDWLYQNRIKYLNKTKEDITDVELLRGFKISGLVHGYTVFDNKPMLYILDKYPITSVYDPCAGWGERFLTCYFHNVSYFGVDVNHDLCDGYSAMGGILGVVNQHFANLNAAEYKPSGDFDAIITCPPYHNTELYSSDGAENLDYTEFLSWWKTVIQNCKVVNPKYFCFQINQKYKIDMQSIVEEEGFVFVEEICGHVASSHFNRKKEGINQKHEFESMLVFERKD